MSLNTCSAMFRESGQSMVGTATRAKGYLFLPIPMKLWGENGISSKWATEETVSEIEESSDLGIRVRLFAPISKFDAPMYFGDQALRSHAEDIVKSAGLSKISERTGAFVFICCHGKRDQCCALWGNRLHRKVSSAGGSIVALKCSHLGGDRFAPTAVFFPSGNMYGSISDNDLEHVINCEQRGRFFPKRYRGCVFESIDMQLARYALSVKENETSNSADISVLSADFGDEIATICTLYRRKEIHIHFEMKISELASDCRSLRLGNTKAFRSYELIDD